MAVLALDLATTTGWAVHSKGMDRPYFGAMRFSSKVSEVGAQLTKLHLFIVDQHKMHGLTDIVFEAQHIAGGKMNPDTIYRLFALGGHVEYLAHRLNLRCFKLHISTWRKHFLGKPPGRTGQWNREDAKQAALAMCATYGWHMDSADAAEACGILDCYLAMIPHYVRPWRDKALLGGIL